MKPFLMPSPVSPWTNWTWHATEFEGEDIFF